MAESPSLVDDAVRARFEAARGDRALTPELEQDLQLAVACALGRAPALEKFDALLREEVARTAAQQGFVAADELAQLVRERLLVAGDDGRRRIEEYRAEAPLRAWVRAVAVRTGLNARRGQAREELASQPPEVDAPGDDPELALMRARYREAFRGAFAAAVAALGARERTVLRLHTLDGVTLARIGAMYEKDTSTVSRWLEQIRRRLLNATREHLGARLQLSPSELDSVMCAAPSEMTVSLPRLLAPEP